MKLTNAQISALRDTAIRAAKEAGMFIVQRGHKKSVSRKGDDPEQPQGGLSLASQVVTEVDVRSQEIILEALRPTMEQYDIALLAEEQPDDKSRFERDYFWCVDPLDGTLPFIENRPGFSASIALISRTGIPVLGVVYDPSERTLYAASQGEGAFRNGEQMKPVISPDSDTLHMLIDRSFLKHPWLTTDRQILENLALDLGYQRLEVVQHGGAVLNALRVAELGHTFYLKLPKPERGGGSIWDFAATAAIFRELALPATDVHGNPLDLNRPDDSFMNHRGILYAGSDRIHGLILKWIKGK